MLVYHYSPVNGVFSNFSSEADESPLEPGVFLIPAHATELVPPSPPNPKTQWAVFDGTAWSVEDMPLPKLIRKHYDGAPVEGMWQRISIKEALKGGVT